MSCFCRMGKSCKRRHYAFAAALCLVILASALVDAKQPYKPKRYKLHKDKDSGRTGHVRDKTDPSARKLLQMGSTTVVPGMRLCPSATEAANFIVGNNNASLTVSNAQFTKGVCDLTAYASTTGTNGLQWGWVETWPQDHEMAHMFQNTGKPNPATSQQGICPYHQDILQALQQPPSVLICISVCNDGDINCATRGTERKQHVHGPPALLAKYQPIVPLVVWRLQSIFLLDEKLVSCSNHAMRSFEAAFINMCSPGGAQSINLCISSVIIFH